MTYEPIRIADVAVDRRTLKMLHALFPWWALFVIWRLKYSEKQTSKSAKLLRRNSGQGCA